MSDLIRREDALDAFEKKCTLNCTDRNGIYDGKIRTAIMYEGVMEILNNIPSAEPEEEVFEWCHDCKEYDQEKHCCHRWTKVIRQTVEEMKAEPERRWIPVTEALPNNSDWVLGQIRETDSGYLWIPRVVEYREIKDDWYEDSIGWLKKNPDHAFEVIAWMPLPEPYRGE